MAETEKVTISVPKGMKARLQARVDRGEIPSISGYFVESATDRLSREEWLAQWRAATPTPTPEALAWADDLIDQVCGPHQERRAS
jgi:hypothetical protein